MITIRIPASIEQLRPLRETISRELPEKYRDLQFKAELITEEILTNICKYAYNDQGGDATFSCGMASLDNNDVFLIEITDSGTEYNPFANINDQFESSVETRKIGGVGLCLVQQMATHYAYIRIENKNKLQIFLSPAMSE
jgi:anti-sigma regulatory factor (Ser/Thr protein kinase)